MRWSVAYLGGGFGGFNPSLLEMYSWLCTIITYYNKGKLHYKWNVFLFY